MRHVIGTGPLRAAILEQGSILQDVRLGGIDHSLTLGTSELALYEGSMASFGGLIGPVVNRIAGASAPMDEHVLFFEENKPGVTLHSGGAGTHRMRWDATERSETTLTLALDLPAGMGGFPGDRRVEAHWRAEGGTLTLTVTATTDAPTFVNFANHSYWNLAGTETYEGHALRVAADRYLPARDDGLPTGDVAEVAGTPFDFREGRAMGPEGPAYDNNLCLSDAPAGRPRDVAVLTGGGIEMTLATTEAGLQVYDAAKMKPTGVPDHQGRPFGPHRGIALEAQGWPDAPNHPDWPSVRLDPGETYRQVTSWSFERV